MLAQGAASAPIDGVAPQYIPVLELMAKSRHRKAENLRRYFKPSPQAMRDLTALLGPGADRRR
ncbi:hypothetical protein [Nocardia asteroides]